MNQKQIIERAKKVLPAGSFGNFESGIIIQKGQGSRVWDEDNNEYIDYLIGSGPMMLGHNHPEVTEAVVEQLSKGTTFFANNERGIALAEEICRAVACAEQVRYVSSGGEADMYAMRLARAYTGRNKILKFEGGYHGMSAEAQMSLAPEKQVDFPTAVPDSAGIPKSVQDAMLIAPYNDAAFVSALMAEQAADIAAVIVEPLQRIVPPEPGFLEHLRSECSRYGVLLIFDEVVTGFRFSYGGAQEAYGVVPDICTLGKVIGGGFPSAAIAGSAEIMSHFDKARVGSEGFLMQLGTLSGNPVAAVAGLKTMEILRREGQYDTLIKNGERLMQSLAKHLSAAGHAHQIVGHPTLFEVVFTDQPVRNYRDFQSSDKARLAKFTELLRENGVFKSVGKVYVSLALSQQDLDETEAAIEKSVAALV